MPHVVVTGSNRGMGLEFCRQYSSSGWQVSALCRKSSDELNALGVTVHENIDLENPSSLDKLDEKIETPVDVLVNNAGLMLEAGFEEVNFDNMLKEYKVNALGPVFVTKALLSRFIEDTKVIMITSRMGSITDTKSGGYYGYRMAKAGLNMAAKALAIDLREKGIAVGIFHPGFVRTEMTKHRGTMSVAESVRSLTKLISDVNLDNTGTFIHINGQLLPW